MEKSPRRRQNLSQRKNQMKRPEEKKAKAKAKKGKKQEEEGFELWNELEVQRNKFMVITVIYLYTSFTVM